MSIKLKLLQYKYDDSNPGNSKLKLEITGENAKIGLLNSIRRIIYSGVPNYAFSEINIKKNTSVFNNDYMRNRIEQFPVLDINTDKIIIDNSDMENNLVISMNFKNETQSNMNVTSDELKFYINNNETQNIFPKPIKIIELNPNESFEFNAQLKLGNGKLSGIYHPISCISYNELLEDKFEFTISSVIGKYSEFDLLKKGCEILLYKIKNIYNKLEKETLPDHFGSIKLEHENHTIGNLICYFAQKEEYIESFSYKMEHLLNNEIDFNYRINNKYNIKKMLRNIYNNINDTLNLFIKEIDRIRQN